ncbi:flagellar motor switch protein FliN [candidate division LCP-89 bacterium B3_LCP]|uniref:Flagellar motor switch protein FliN n=1 Tax=candidate division LCP-89 bacterium B3_LCP TaxID=2012998 RepID=A0A532V5I7_UNCL8|nr:MAG: flagellar motor switch protein FliN [candidate division LCP-89 bacterium B3_LCP]
MTVNNSLDNVRKVLEPILENVATSLSMALNHTAEIELGEIHPANMQELAKDYPDEAVCMDVAFVEGFSDKIGFVLASKWAGTWTDLMLMGDGKAEFSPDEHLDGIGELLNQVNGVMVQGFSDLAGSAIKLDPVVTALDQVSNREEQWESYFRIDLTLAVEGFDQGTITMLLSPQFVEDLSSLAKPADEIVQMEDRPPPAVLDDVLESDQATEVRPAAFEEFGTDLSGGSGQSINVLMDVELPVIIELGRTNMFIRDILELCPGTIVELNKLSGEPVDLLINDKKFARGEVVVIDENFGIRITELVKVEDRIQTLK